MSWFDQSISFDWAFLWFIESRHAREFLLNCEFAQVLWNCLIRRFSMETQAPTFWFIFFSTFTRLRICLEFVLKFYFQVLSLILVCPDFFSMCLSWGLKKNFICDCEVWSFAHSCETIVKTHTVFIELRNCIIHRVYCIF